MKAREKQGEFDVKLMQSLERIENKLDKKNLAQEKQEV